MTIAVDLGRKATKQTNKQERPLEVQLAPGHNSQTERSQLGLVWCGLQGRFL